MILATVFVVPTSSVPTQLVFTLVQAGTETLHMREVIGLVENLGQKASISLWDLSLLLSVELQKEEEIGKVCSL